MKFLSRKLLLTLFLFSGIVLSLNAKIQTTNRENPTEDPCEITTFPFIETFEGNSMPECWTILNLDEDNKEWKLNTSSGFESNHCAIISYNGNGNNDWLISPKLTINSDDLFLMFAAKSGSSTFLESYNVLISQTDNAPSSFTTVLENIVNAPNEWTNKSYQLSDFGINAGQSFYVAIQCVSVDKLNFYVDDIRIAQKNTATDIVNFSLDNQNGETVIDAENHTITVPLHWYTDITSLTATFELSQLASASIGETPQESASTINNFTNPVVYTVTAEDGTTTQDWTISTTFTDKPIGSDCSLPYTIELPADLPYSTTGQTTFGLGNIYGTLSTSDNGQEAVYEINVTEDISVKISLDPGFTSSTKISIFDACPDTGNQITSSSTTGTISHSFETVLNPGTYYLTVDVSSGNISNYDLNIETTCIAVSDLSASNIGLNNADINWNVNGLETEWNFIFSDTEISDFSSANSQLLSTNSFNATDLTHSTDYYVYVQANCSSELQSDWEELNFQTECGVHLPPYNETFETFAPNCWIQAKGSLTDNIELEDGSSSWTDDVFLNNTSDNNSCAKLNIYGTTKEDWLITPSIDLGDGSKNHQLEFMLGLTDFGNQDPIENTDGNDDVFAVLISTDNGASWNSSNILRKWDNNDSEFTFNEISHLGELIVLDLSTYSGIIKIAFYGESTATNADNDLFIDNINIIETPDCQAANSFIIENTTFNSCTFSWTDLSETTDWNIKYGITGFDPETEGTEYTTDIKPSTINNLASATTYDIYIQTICENSTTEWAGPFIFTTECDTYNLFPFTENFENEIPSLCWQEVRTPASSNGWDSNSNGFEGNCARFNSYNNSNGNISSLITPEFDLTNTTHPVLKFKYKNAKGGDFSVLLSTDGGNTFSETLISGLTNQTTWTTESISLLDYITNESIYIAFTGTSNYGSGDAYIYLDNLEICEASDETEILSYSINGETEPATIDSENHTISVELIHGSDFTNIISVFTLSEGATASIGDIDQISNETSNDASSGSLTYTITAEDGISNESWSVNITEGPAFTDTEILTFELQNQTSSTINSEEHNITVTLPYYANLSENIAEFTLSYGATATINDVAQVSGTTSNNFSNEVIYTITAQDGIAIQTWTVSVSKEETPAGAYCSNAISYGSINDPVVNGIINSDVAQWYTVTLNENYTNVIVSVCGANFDSRLAVFAACDETSTTYGHNIGSNPANSIAYDDDSCDDQEGSGLASHIEIEELTAGTYYVVVYGYGSSTNGTFPLQITGDIDYTTPFVNNTNISLSPESLSINLNENANGTMEITYPATVSTEMPESLMTDAMLDFSELPAGTIIELYQATISLGSYTVVGGESIWASNAFENISRAQASLTAGQSLTFDIVISGLTAGTYNISATLQLGTNENLNSESNMTELSSDTMEITVNFTDITLIEPSSGYACDLTATTQIPVEVENAGADMIASGESFTFTVESEGTTVLTEDFTLDTDLNAGDTWNGVTTNTIDLSAIGATFYTASITYAEDINTDNDTIHGYIVHFEQTLEFTDAVNDTITINASDYPYTIETSLTINPDSTLVTEYLWEDGSTTSTFTATQDDWYTVTIITDGECELTDSVFVRAFNAIETNNNNEFAIFPNPSNGQFTIEMTLAEKQDVIITIVNTNGQVVREMKFDDINKLAREINMSDVAEGLYNIRINAGGEMTNRQIIIK